MKFVPFQFIDSVCGHLSQKSLVRIQKNFSNNNFWQKCADRHSSNYKSCSLRVYDANSSDFQTKAALKKQLKKMEKAPPLYRRISEIWIEGNQTIINPDDLIAVTKVFVEKRMEGCPGVNGRLFLRITILLWMDRLMREIPNLALVFTEYCLTFSGDSLLEFTRKVINNGHARCLRLEGKWPEEICPDVERFMTQRQWYRLSTEDKKIMSYDYKVFERLLNSWLADPLTEYYYPFQCVEYGKSLTLHVPLTLGHFRPFFPDSSSNDQEFRALHPSGTCSVCVEFHKTVRSMLTIAFEMV